MLSKATLPTTTSDMRFFFLFLVLIFSEPVRNFTDAHFRSFQFVSANLKQLRRAFDVISKSIDINLFGIIDTL